SYSTYVAKGSTSVMIDGAMYYLSTSQTNGTGGANACESGHTGAWTNITATRATHRTCGTVTVSDHFASWAAQGWSLGTLSMVHINVEVGGGMGTVDFHVDVDHRSEEHTSELQSLAYLVCRLLLEKKKKNNKESK